MRYPITSKETGTKRIRLRGSLRVLGNVRISGNAINVPDEKWEAFYLFYSSERAFNDGVL